MPLNAELLASCLTPIAADAPSGGDLRYDPRLNAIKEARREEILPGAPPKYADWTAVVAQCTALLQKETKDLQLAAWLTEALLRRQGIAGLLTGLAVTRGLIEQFWDSVHPVPEDEDDLELRLGTLEWIGAKLTIPLRLSPVIGRFSCADLEAVHSVPTENDARQDSEKQEIREKAVAEGRLTPEDLEADETALSKAVLRVALADLEATEAELNALDKSCEARFGSDAPSFSGLRSALEEPRRALSGLLARKLEADPDPAEELAEEGATESAEAATGGDGTISVEPSNAADAARRLGVLAKWMRQQRAANPAPYLLLRGFRWGELMAAAPELDPRQLEPPPTAVRTRLRTLVLDGNWSAVLEQGELAMATPAGRGWLDLQRYVVTAATQLGPEFHAIATGIRHELQSVLRAFPQLPRMTLMDDTPTANDETRAWLEQEVLEPEAASDATGQESDESPSDGADLVASALDDDRQSAEQGGFARRRSAHPDVSSAPDAFTLALAELRGGRTQRAIERLTSELARERSPRGRFLRQTQIAYVMVEAGLFAIAHPILQQLIEQIEKQALEQWESGPLVAQPMALMYRVLAARGDDSDEQDRLYLRICQLDPVQALALPAR